jgi:hypothetical protein
MYTSKEKATRAYQAYLAKEHGCLASLQVGQTLKVIANTSFEIKVIRHEVVARVASMTLEISAEVSDHKIDAEVARIKKRDKNLDPEDQTDPRPNLEDEANDVLKSLKHDFRIGTDGSLNYSKSDYDGAKYLDFTINGKTFSVDQLDGLYAQDVETRMGRGFERDDDYEVNFVNPEHMRYEVA